MPEMPQPDTAKAIRMHSYGPPAVLNYETVSLAPLGPSEIRIKTLAAAINHTDLQIRAGHWPIQKPDPFPYTPGVEVVGEVCDRGERVDVPAIGDRVITMMQGLGGVRAIRQGGYAEYVTVSADVVARLSGDVDAFDAAALGLAGVTAFAGLQKIGALAGKAILITGASGGVGSAAIAIARAQGALVTGLVSRPEHLDYVRALGAEAMLVEPGGKEVLLPAESYDGILDVVGGSGFGNRIGSLRRNGVLCLVGAVAGSLASFDVWSLLRPITLTGYSSEDLDGPSLGRAVTLLTTLLREGKLAPPHWQAIPLNEAARAHALLEARGVKGRVLLVP